MRSIPDMLHRSIRFHGFSLLVLTLLVFVSPTVGVLTQTYCSNQNTSPDSKGIFWAWQSNGWCTDQCKAKYAFAVVQGNLCWCSNYVPANQVSVSKCGMQCPGFPDERCGSEDAGLFGYVALELQPSGTSSPPPSATTPSAKSSSTFTSSTLPPSSPISLQTVTINGGIVISTVYSLPTESGQPSEPRGSGKSAGTIAGAVVGSLGGLAVIATSVYFLLARRRRQQKEQGEEAGATGENTPPKRNTSTLSKTGLLRTEKDLHPIVPAVTRDSGQNGSDPANSAPERRNSNIRLYDQRLNPSLLMELDNGSHASIITMEDNRDYNRVLNVRNPDPPDRDGA